MKKIYFVLFVLMVMACGNKTQTPVKSDAETMTIDTSQTLDATGNTKDATGLETKEATEIKVEKSSSAQRDYFLHEIFQLYSMNFFETVNPLSVDALKRTIKALEADCLIVCPNDLKEIIFRMKDLLSRKEKSLEVVK
jgi:uncharacterized protein YcfL